MKRTSIIAVLALLPACDTASPHSEGPSAGEETSSSADATGGSTSGDPASGGPTNTSADDGGESSGVVPTGSGSGDAGGGETTGGVDLPDPMVECTHTIDASVPAEDRFDGVAAGDVLCLEDGEYSGGLDVPSGVTVAALNAGRVTFQGGDSEWSSVLAMHGENSTVWGVRVTRPDNVNSSACEISGENNRLLFSSCSHGGRYKHAIPLRVSGVGHLIEDSWFYGEGRYVIMCFIGDHLTLRRNIARWDATAPNEPDEPNAAFSNYNCSDNVWENNISLDYGVPETPMNYGGDFYLPNNESIYPELNHDVHYFGNMVVNHSSGTSNNRGFRADNNHGSTIVGGIVRDQFTRGSEVAFVIKPNYEFEISDCTQIDVANEFAACSGEADISVRYLDGEKTNDPLFPFPNEALAKADMCAPGERQSDWCSFDGPLEEYVLGGGE